MPHATSTASERIRAQSRRNRQCPTCQRLARACTYHYAADYDTWIEVADADGLPFTDERESNILKALTSS